MMSRSLASRDSQQGVILIEALIAILIFSIGILAAVGMQSVALKNVTESRSRSEAAFFANQLLAQMWLDQNINPANGVNVSNVSSANYGYPDGPSVPTRLTNWVSQVNNKLPQSTQKVTITNESSSGATVTIEIDWQLPEETGVAAHRHVVVAAIQV